MEHLGDITKLKGAEIPQVDVIIGGSPCQDLSIAGQRKGLSGERSGLFMEQIRVVREMRKKMLKLEEQRTKSDHDFKYGKTSPEHCPAAKGKTSELSSKKPQRLRKKLPLFLNLQRENGETAGAYWEEGGLLLGEYSMHSFGESPSAAVESHLWQILEDTAPQKYYLSMTACLGILRRAEKRKKKLPPLLEIALLSQIHADTSSRLMTGQHEGENQQNIQTVSE